MRPVIKRTISITTTESWTVTWVQDESRIARAATDKEDMEDMTMGTALIQGDLWGARTQDWAEIQEATLKPVFTAALREAKVGPATTYLDVGCGAGMACQMAAQLGAKVSGLDASAAMIEIAKRRVPGGDFRAGEMEELPFADQAFDVVTGFNSFQYAADPAHALSESRRVANKGAPVIVAVWGKQEDCEAAAFVAALGSLLPPPPPGAPGPFALSQDGALETLVSQAGLTPGRLIEVDAPFDYPDEETALRGLLSAGPAVRAIRHAGEERAREVMSQAIAPFRVADSSYHIRNKFRVLIATA
jgi:SAM-dependent methyltransferase